VRDVEDEDAALVEVVTTFYGQYKHGEEKKGKTKAYKEGFPSLLESTRGRNIATLAEWAEFADACDALLRLGIKVEREKVLEELRLRAEAARELREELAREKLRRGAISYDDMLRGLVESLRARPDLAARLRGRYKACIVDEFQDTDPVQWEILDRLCLREDAGNPVVGEVAPVHSVSLPSLPLFLVGDPKQAIYGFRGGDLRTYLVARGVSVRWRGKGARRVSR
jgi:ATP-dependent exoDNAse (exonuclease V) beta subunit